MIDPCMGSGHILVYAFDVLMDIYRSVGYTDRDAVQSIVQNNLYGLDIDDRAAQLAYFAVMMKACEYDRRFLRRGVQPHVCAIAESAPLAELSPFGAEKALAQTLLDTFRDAKEYGSLLHVPLSLAELQRLAGRTAALQAGQHDTLLAMADNAQAAAAIQPLLLQAQILARQYDAVITNPPYMGASGMNDKLSKFVKDNYPDSKGDMSTCFMERTLAFSTDQGFMAMLNIPVWMFLSSYEKLRMKIIAENTFVNMVHPGRGIFGSDFGTTSFVIAKCHIVGYEGNYRRLFEKQGEVASVEERQQAFLSGRGQFTAQQDNFSKIPGAPVAYWVSESILNAYNALPQMCQFGDLKHGMTTGKNDVCLKYWYEINRHLFLPDAHSQIEFEKSGCVYVPYNKGGPYQKWYGNLDYVLGYSLKYNEYMDTLTGHRHDNPQYYYKKSITWSLTNSSFFGARLRPAGSIFDVNGMSMFVFNDSQYNYLLALMCSKVSSLFMKINNPTLASQVGDVSRIPVQYHLGSRDTVSILADICVQETKVDWDSFEISWDFKKHPMI